MDWICFEFLLLFHFLNPVYFRNLYSLIYQAIVLVSRVIKLATIVELKSYKYLKNERG